MGRLARTSLVLLLAGAAGWGCTKLVGVDGEYTVGSQDAGSSGGGAAGTGGTSGASGTSGAGGTSGQGGEAGSGGAGGESGQAGAAGTGGQSGSGGSAGSGGSSGAGGQAGSSGAGGQAGSGGSGVVSPLESMRFGITSLPIDEASVTAHVGGVDPDRSILTFGYRFAWGTPSQAQVSGQISAQDTLTFQRGYPDGVEVPIHYYVATFASGVTVQRGSTPMTSTTATANLDTPVTIGKAFPLITLRTGGTYYGPWNYVTATLSGPNALTLQANDTNPDTVVEWQVVSFEGASVQTGTVAVGAADTTVQTTMDPVDPAATWLTFTYDLGNMTGGGVEYRMIRGRIADSTQLEFTREESGAAGNVRWYAVTFDNGTTVVSGESTMTDPELTVTSPMSPSVDVSKSLATAIGLYGRGGSTTSSENNICGGTVTLDLDVGSAVKVSRGCTGSNNSMSGFSWSAIEFQ